MAEVKPDKSDRKRVTLREVAQEAGVSLKTASNVINHSGRMADATREKVQDVIDRLGYRVNVSARNLNRGKTGFITLAVPSLTAPYLAELANRVIDAARIYGYSVYITTYAEGSAQGARALLRNFNATVSDGMILSISEVEDLDPEDLDVDYPLVCVGARSTHGKADHVTPDDVQEARLAAQYLFDHGATNLAVIGSRTDPEHILELRRRGRQRAAAHARHIRSVCRPRRRIGHTASAQRRPGLDHRLGRAHDAAHRRLRHPLRWHRGVQRPACVGRTVHFGSERPRSLPK